MKKSFTVGLCLLLAGCGGKTGWTEVDPNEPLPDRQSTATFTDGRAYGQVLRLSEEFGNLYTSFVEGDLDRLGISQGQTFTFGKGERSYSVKLATTYADVPEGQWVAFFTDEGMLKIARNMRNAAVTTGCVPGDKIYISPAR